MLTASYHTSRAKTTGELEAANAFQDRWRAEVVLLSLLCPAPRYRWGGIAKRLGITPADWSWEDTRIIADALAEHHDDGPAKCAHAAAERLGAAGYWDFTDERTHAASSRWGPGPLAAMFTKSMNLRDESVAIAAALAAVRKLPAMPKGVAA